MSDESCENNPRERARVAKKNLVKRSENVTQMFDKSAERSRKKQMSDASFDEEERHVPK